VAILQKIVNSLAINMQGNTGLNIKANGISPFTPVDE
jgi:hypothetical protein